MRLRQFIWIFSLIVVFTAFARVTASIEPDANNTALLPLPAVLEQQADPEWLGIFKQELENNYRNSFLMPTSLDMLANIMAKEAFPADPYLAANLYFNLARKLDLQIKQGTAVNRAKMITRKIWQEFKTANTSQKADTASVVAARIDKIESIASFVKQDDRKNELSITVKDDKIKKEKLAELEKEKPTPKPAKTPKPDKTKTEKPQKTQKP